MLVTVGSQVTVATVAARAKRGASTWREHKLQKFHVLVGFFSEAVEIQHRRLCDGRHDSGYNVCDWMWMLALRDISHFYSILIKSR